MNTSNKPQKYPINSAVLRDFNPAALKALYPGAPPGAENLIERCKCGKHHVFDWSQPREEVAPEIRNGQLHVLAGIGKRCECGRIVPFLFPKAKNDLGIMPIHGDESYEYFDDQRSFLFLYAFVAFSEKFYKKVLDELHRVKLVLRPELDPSKWVLHLTDLRSGNKRDKMGVSASRAQVDTLISDLLKTLDGRQCIDRLISVFAYRTEKGGTHTKKENDFIRDSTLMHALLGITEKVTRIGFEPRFILEAVEGAHNLDQIDPFVERVGRTCMSMIQYHYVARGRALTIPISVPKGSRPQHEFADIVAFVIRKTILQLLTGKKVDFDIESMGPIYWGLAKPHALARLDKVGIPMVEWG